MNMAACTPLDETLDPKNADTWPLWLSIPEAAAVLRLSISTIRGLTQARKLRSRRFGRQLRIHKSDLLAFTN